MSSPTFKNLSLSRRGDVFILTLQKPPENRLNAAFCQEIIRALRHAQDALGPSSAGALVTRGSDAKFWCTGLELDETDRNPFANADGFYPMLRAILDFPYPTVACITGHTFGGGCPFALAHDYRVMNESRGFFCMPPVDLGLHFDGIGALPRLKLAPRVARQMLLEAHRWTGRQALADGIVDAVAAPEGMVEAAVEIARRWAGKAKGGVYGVLREELYGDAMEKLGRISYVRSRRTSREALAKI